MQFVPAGLALFVVYCDLTPLSTGRHPALRLIFLATLGAAMAVGLPLRLALTAATANIVSREQIQRIVRAPYSS